MATSGCLFFRIAKGAFGAAVNLAIGTHADGAGAGVPMAGGL